MEYFVDEDGQLQPIVDELPEPPKPRSVFANVASKGLVVATGVTLAATTVFAVIDKMDDNEDASASGSAISTELGPAFDLSILKGVPEATIGYSRDDKGLFGISEPWTNIEGVVIKDYMYRPPFPIRTQVREDPWGPYVYVYMLDDEGQEVPFRFDHITAVPLGAQDCALDYEGDELTFDNITFPECPAPNSPEWRGAISTRADDGVIWNENQIVDDAARMTDVMTQGTWCMNKLFGSSLISQSGPEYEFVSQVVSEAFKAEPVNPTLAYDRWEDGFISTIRRQVRDGYQIPLYNAAGLPNIRFLEQEEAILEMYDLYGAGLIDDYEQLKARAFLYDSSSWVSSYERREGLAPAVEMGDSYAQQLIDLAAKHSNMSIGDDDNLYVDRDNPDASFINTTCTLAYRDPANLNSLVQSFEDNRYAAGLIGVPMRMPDGTFMSETELQQRFNYIAGIEGTDETAGTTATTVVGGAP